MARKIRLLKCTFGQATISPKSSQSITTVTIHGPMDQIIADALGVKDAVYKRKRDDDEADITEFCLDTEYPGAKLVLMPLQATVNGKVKIDAEYELPGLKVSDFKIKRHKDDQQMLISFKVTLLDADAVLHQLMHNVKTSDFNCDVYPAAKKAAEEAEKQLKLIGKPEKSEDSEDPKKKKTRSIDVQVEG